MALTPDIEEGVAISGVLGLNQCFEKIVQITFDAFAQHEAVLAGKAAGVVTTP